MSDALQWSTFVWEGWIIVWPTSLLAIIWIAWLVSWVAGSFWSARTEKRVAIRESLVFLLPIMVGAVLLSPWPGHLLGEKPVWRPGTGGVYALAGVAVAGLSFTWWARMHLGRLWSSAITRKEGHRVVDTGPYGLVRHPIYTGLIAATLATGVAVATATALVGAMLIALGLWQKAGLEERFLTVELGSDAYRAYRRRVPMLVPFLPWR
jgi:protein-S-isoprenylcysteine O-methyltransferase Ste14